MSFGQPIPDSFAPPADASTDPDSALDWRDEVIDGRYALRRRVGVGGVCAVWEASHIYTGRPVAVKLLRSEYADHAEARERLLREARALGTVRHPNVVDVIDAGVTGDGTAYVVMEMLYGRSLEGLIASRGRLPVGDAVFLVRQVADALGVLHAQGLVHRDIKPGNIFIVHAAGGGEAAKLVDFGIMRGPAGNGATYRKLTAPGVFVGTPEYMAAEQLLANPHVDARADVYSLGVTLYECLSGTVPFPGEYYEVFSSVARGLPPPPLRNTYPDVPPMLARLVERALSFDPSQRFADAAAFAQALVATGLDPRRSQLLSSVDPTTAARAKPTQDPGEVRPPVAPPRRKHSRAPYATPVRVRLDGAGCEGRSEDISEGGMLVTLPLPLPSNARVNIRFSSPMTGEIVTCPATVQWVRDRPHGQRRRCAAGLAFFGLPPTANEAIRRYVGLFGSAPTASGNVR